MSDSSTDFKLPWPKVQNLISTTALGTVMQLHSQNLIVAISEKLDGSNICLSSAKWIASRRKIIVKPNFQNNFTTFENTLAQQKFCNQSLASLSHLFSKLENIKTHLNDTMCLNNLADFEVLLYGEWMQKGTSTGRIDKYQYSCRNIQAGKMYAFGIGFEFQRLLTDQESHAVTSYMKHFNLVYNRVDVKNETYSKTLYQIFFNLPLFAMLKKFDIDTVPFLGEHSFVDLINNKSFLSALLENQCEGFMLVICLVDKAKLGLDNLLKWKPSTANEHRNEIFRHYEHLVFTPAESENLKPIALGSTETAVISQPSIDLILHHLYNSAKTKYPHLADLLDDQEDSAAAVVAIKQRYQHWIVCEMKADVDENYFQLEMLTLEQIKTFAKHMIWKETM